MIGEEEAREKILSQLPVLHTRKVSLGEALDAFCARDLVANLSLPSFDNSSMDGYAVLAQFSRPGARLRVSGEQPAGLDRKLTVGQGEAVRILTGAPMPAGADAVVMQEDTTVEGDFVCVNTEVERGENVRRSGGDVAKGQKIAAAGDRLRPQMLGLLAAQGLSSIEVGAKVRAAVISTGDELASAGDELLAGQIYDSNSVLLAAMLRSCGVELVSVTHCRDHAEEIEGALRAGLDADVLLIAGGVSVGTRDLVKPALSAIGATLDFWRVAVKPGKPFLFGRMGNCAIFGLPGNPVSAFVTFLLFVRPALLRLMGANDAALGFTRVPARLSQEIHNLSERRHYVRGILREGRFIPVGRQESHALFGLSQANALLRVDAQTKLEAGAGVTAFLWT